MHCDFEKVNSINLCCISGGKLLNRALKVGLFSEISLWPVDEVLQVNAKTHSDFVYKMICV